MKKSRDIFWGGAAKEEFHFLLSDKNSKMPVIIENVGYTPPNPRYTIRRTDNHYFVFEYVISGKGYLEINGQTYTVEAGDVYCVQPGYDHEYYPDSNEPFEKVWINFFSDVFIEVFKAFGIRETFVFKNCQCYHLFKELRSLAETSNSSDDLCYQIAGILFQIVCLMAESKQAKPHASNTAVMIKELLDNSLYSNITIEEISNQVHLSKIQVTREFSKYYGQTPYNYLLELKIKLAKQFLTKSDYTVNEISDKLGFSDSHYFSRIFKKKTGLSPTLYRKKIRILP